MASMGRLVRAARACRTISSSKTLTPSSDHVLRLYQRTPFSPGSGSFKDHLQANTFNGHWSRHTPKIPRSCSLFPAILAGLFGVRLLDIAYAEAKEEPAKSALPSECPSNYLDLEELAKQERRRLEELLRSKGLKYGSYPRFTVAIKGQKVTIKFEIPPTCEVPHLMASLGSHLGLKVDEGAAGSDMMLRAWDSSVAWQLSLSNPEKQEGGSTYDLPEHTTKNKGELCILISRAIISSDKAEIEFIKRGSFSDRELDAFVSALQLAGAKTQGNGKVEKKSKDSVSGLEALGVRVFGLDGPQVGSSAGDISWENIAGYHQQKREIEDTVLLALQSPEVYDDIAHGTRCKFESNRPRAVLFEGPPGTGKTSCARVIANQAGVPLLYVPLEVVMSKYYGESERLLGKVFSLANELPNGAIVFLDEVDSFAVTRDTEMHEATRRILSVLLRQIDGFEQDKKVVVIAATNRKQDLDPALMSRFDSMVTFDLPDQQTREAIAAQYAKHLTKSELVEFARVTEEMSGRDIRDVCQQAERHWASKIIRGQVAKDGEQVGLPPLQEYTMSAIYRRKAMLCTRDPSGMLVHDPSQGNDVDSIFQQARQLGAVERPVGQHNPPSSSRSFTGTGRLLSGETVPSIPQQTQPDSIIHNIIFWSNGFTVNDGPLRRLDDPENASFLESIKKSECPEELEPPDRRSSVNVNLIRRNENCPDPEKRQAPFQGVGRTLGSVAPSAASEQGLGETSVSCNAAPSTGLTLDESLPSTSIQLRLADGTRMIAHLNYHHTIGHIRSLLDASWPRGARSYQLQTMGFPPKQLTDPNETIEQAGLANSVVIQKF